MWLEGIDAGDGHLSPSGQRFFFYRDADIRLTERDAEVSGQSRGGSKR